MPFTHRLIPFLAALALHPAWAQKEDMDAGQRPAAQASGASLTDTFRNLRDRFKGPAASAPPEAATTGAPAAAATTPAPTPPDNQRGRDTGAGGSLGTIKLKEFTVGSKLPPNWNDTHCKNLVEPFDIKDSALSLAKFKAQAEGKSMLEKVIGTRARTVDPRAEVRRAARQLNWLPMALEVQLGERLHRNQTAHLMGENKSGKELYVRARRLLAEELAQVKEPHPYRFKIFVVTAAGGNAESGPGGFIYVDRDLVAKAADEPKARFAIAHEVSHVLQRHRTRETQMRLADGIDSFEDLGRLMASPQAGVDSMAAKGVDLKRLFVRHSEEQELQADGCGVRIVDASSASRAEVVKAVEAFLRGLPPPGGPEPKAAAKGAEAVFTELSDGEFSRHPNSEKRRKNLNEVLATLNASPK